ncbi:G patch domain-containing protein 1 homolog [Bactrocera tryoni]|uniref:G patch domain-containing protein 1 homolog n=1 Tax=Bactrocera tryoni TaxID=59916 RepID=UPI001A99A770|nr:G patch domain-containing protein 1 homolog [Bactrocera tryoni]
MYDEAGLHRFGTTLPALDEDSVPSKKPIRVEDQIVTDENGKRRFHGAFTGGFSAGYWNTVGSQEGWTPATFKSSRSEKAAQRQQQRPDDFMDDEDRGEFGIAPQRLQTRAEYTSFEPELNRKRKLMTTHSGPIPGKPVLEQLIVPNNVKISERILKSMGWRPGQGIGPRQTRKEKKSARSRNQREMYVMQQYGYQPNASATKSPEHSDDAGGETESSDEETDKITFAPDDYEPYVCLAKKDRFGLGYRGSLSRDPVLSNAQGVVASDRHINLFEPALEAVGKNNKKISFKGQAFGVGALEDEDEDIYARDDMSRYDFSLEDRKPQKKKVIIEQDQLVVDGFSACKNPLRSKNPENIVVPANFTPRNWAERKSRFQPIDAKRAEELESYFKKVEHAKNRLNPDERAELLGEERQIEEQPTTSTHSRAEQANNQRQSKANPDLQPALQDTKSTRVAGGYDKMTDKANSIWGSLEQNDRFTRASDIDREISSVNSSEFAGMVKEAYSKSKDDSLTSMFKPFVHDEQKQRRYEEFLLAEVKTEEEITCFLNKIQPVHLNAWDREMEKKEFMQASKIFRPLDGLMSQRFVSESSLQVEQKSSATSEIILSSPKKITVERSRSMWKPHSLLCKRYNIAEPFGGHMEEEKRPTSSSKMSVFDYLEDCLHKKSDFKTPVIVPMKIPEIKPILKHTKCGTDKEETNDTKSATSVTTCTVSTMTSCSPSSSLSDTSIVVVDQLKSAHAGSKRSKDDGPKVGRHTAKTDLEKLSAESISKPSYEKLELYKAIFDDSSDEEGVEQYEVTVISREGDNTDACAVKKAEQVNLLRNTSPPRGIFSALLSKKGREKTPEKTDCNSMESIDMEEKSSPTVMVSGMGLIPAAAKPVNNNRIEFKRPTSISSKTSVNSASTVSTKLSSNEESTTIQSSKGENNSTTLMSPEGKSKSVRLQGSGNALGATAVTFELPSTSSGVVTDAYGPQLPQHVRPQASDNAVDQMNKVVEEKMIRFLVQRAKNSRQLDNEGWVEKKVRKILKTTTRSSSSSSSSDEDDASYKSERNARKKKSKKSKSHKKSKKKSKEKRPKKSKKKKDK